MNPTLKKFLVIMSAFIFLFVFHPYASAQFQQSGMRLKPGPEDHIWTLDITATGQVIDVFDNVDTVSIGVTSAEEAFPHPGPPPDYTVYIYLGEELLEDYRQIGSPTEIWNLLVRIEDSADANLPDFFPELSWNPNDIGPASRMELRLGSETGTLLVTDMRTTGSYQTKASDAYFYDPDIDEARISYSIVFEQVTISWYRDDDHDGCGDPNDSIQAQSQPPGYVLDPCDCDDTDEERYVGNAESCDGKDNDCDGIVPADETTDEDEDGLVACNDCDDADPNRGGCDLFYRDQDEDELGVSEDFLCLCDPEGYYTASQGGDPDDSDANIPGPAVIFDMNLDIGWSMISLPVEPLDPTVGTLFPDALAVFRFTTRYELLEETDSIVKGEGYWIYVPAARTYTIIGVPIMEYTIQDISSNWSMIGGCTYPAYTSIANGTIRAIFGFDKKYYLVDPHDPNDPLEAGEGYWINLSEQTTLTVEVK